VPSYCLLAAAARGIGADGASCGKAIHRVSHCPKARGAPVGAMADMSREEPAGADRVARWEVSYAPGSPSRGVVTCDSLPKTPVRWGRERVVTTGWRRVVTTRLAQRCWGRARAKLQQWPLG
jgi:hypothetical protein